MLAKPAKSRAKNNRRVKKRGQGEAGAASAATHSPRLQFFEKRSNFFENVHSWIFLRFIQIY
jgi:hypothetical protein